MLSKYIYDDPASKELEVDSFSITQVMQYALIYDPCTLKYIIQKKNMLSKYIYDDPASKELEVDSFSITQVIQYALIYDPCTLKYIIQKKIC